MTGRLSKSVFSPAAHGNLRGSRLNEVREISLTSFNLEVSGVPLWLLFYVG